MRQVATHHRAARRAFSLAELMIALAILGMGLLVIGAALPLGVRFTRESIDRDTGAAATDYALSVLQRSLGIVDRILDPNSVAPSLQEVTRASGLFVPRDPNSGRFDPDHVPRVKVRPILTQNISMPTSTAQFAASDYIILRNNWVPGTEIPVVGNLPTPVLATEQQVGRWLTVVYPGGGGEYSPLEVAEPWNGWDWRTAQPAISAAEVVYPPVSSGAQVPAEEYAGDPLRMYWTQQSASLMALSDATKIMSQRIAWVTFARRVSYGPGSDPYLYEMITVATRRPSERHRYPVPGWRWGAGGDPVQGHRYTGIDSVAPIPWLVTFSDRDELGVQPSLPRLLPDVDYVRDDNRALTELGQQKVASAATLRFVAERIVGDLMPAGSILIPAVLDDDDPSSPGFVPACKDILPIYEVVQRVWNPSLGQDGHYEVIVKSNGYYPWVGDNPPPTDSPFFPVWVIPPAFEEYESEDDIRVPVFPDQSPIVAVSRRFVRLREVP